MGERAQTVRKTFKYRLHPTPEQAQALGTVLQWCRSLYNVALEQRKTWWQRGQGKSATYYQQKAELPELKAACPDYAEVNAQVLYAVASHRCRMPRPTRLARIVADAAIKLQQYAATGYYRM